MSDRTSSSGEHSADRTITAPLAAYLENLDQLFAAGQPIPFAPASGPVPFLAPGVPIPIAFPDQPFPVAEPSGHADPDTPAQVSAAVRRHVRERATDYTDSEPEDSEDSSEDSESSSKDSEVSSDEEPQGVIEDPITEATFWPELRELIAVSDDEKAWIVAEGGVLPWDRLALECSICYSKMKVRGSNPDEPEGKHDARIAVCGHIFCRNCSDQTWRAKPAKDFSCPNCRQSWNHPGCGHPNMGVAIPHHYHESRDFVPKVIKEGGSLSPFCDECSLNSAMEAALNMVRAYELDVGEDIIGVRLAVNGFNVNLTEHPFARREPFDGPLRVTRKKLLQDLPALLPALVENSARHVCEQIKEGWGHPKYWEPKFELWQYAVEPEVAGYSCSVSADFVGEQHFFEQIDIDNLPGQ